jgi:geranylgeranyl diphosphate synthase type I
MPSLFTTFAQMQVDAIAGQQLDLLATEDVEKTYTLKTGSYTVRGPLLLGAILGGGSARACAALERFALPTGVAFQLRDDVLSAFGDPTSTGKPRGTDIRSGKRTLLVSFALEMAKRSDREALRAAWGNRRATARQIERAVTVIERSGARQRVEQRVDELLETALGALDDSRSLSTPGKELLRGAAHALARRRT